MIISQTGLRISFMGGGTDFEDFYCRYPGRVLSTTINKYFYIGLNPRFDGAIKVSYSKTEFVDHRDQVKHPLVRESLIEAGIDKGIDIVSLADVPSHKTGLGLGSSSAFTVGLLNGLYVFTGRYMPLVMLAEKACEIEIDKVKSPIGKQDQYASALGGLNLITFNCDGKIDVSPIYLIPRVKDSFQKHLLLFFTGKERSANSILSKQKQNIDDKFELLKKMSDMVSIFKTALEAGDLKKMGHMLHEGWLIKKELAGGISNPQIDDMYNRALKAGAWGGKILGAGGGGFLLVMASPDKHLKIKAALNEYQLIPFRFSEGASKIVFRS